MTNYKRIIKNEYVKTAIVIALISFVALGFFYGLRLVLGTSVPIRVVESGSMCTKGYLCDGWSHPFEQTLHVGDIIIIQSVTPEDLNANYPNSDVIVYINPSKPTTTPIVHRIVEKYEVDGVLYFQTKGDGNGINWPAIPNYAEFDSNTLWNTGKGVPENLVLGRVIMRIPYFGWVTLFMKSNSWILPSMIALILLLIVVEFVIPILKAKKKLVNEQQKDPEMPL